MKSTLPNVPRLVQHQSKFGRTAITHDNAGNQGPESIIEFANLEASSTWQTPDLRQHSVKLGYIKDIKGLGYKQHLDQEDTAILNVSFPAQL